jgi:hypothetical protein
VQLSTILNNQITRQLPVDLHILNMNDVSDMRDLLDGKKKHLEGRPFKAAVLRKVSQQDIYKILLSDEMDFIQAFTSNRELYDKLKLDAGYLIKMYNIKHGKLYINNSSAFRPAPPHIIPSHLQSRAVSHFDADQTVLQVKVILDSGDQIQHLLAIKGTVTQVNNFLLLFHTFPILLTNQ